MAHFVIYKRPAEVAPFTVDFTDLLLPGDTQLNSTTSFIKVVDSAGVDQTGYFLLNTTFSGKVMQGNFQNGINGEDYTCNFLGAGDVSFPILFNRILEVRVRLNIAGNL